MQLNSPPPEFYRASIHQHFSQAKVPFHSYRCILFELNYICKDNLLSHIAACTTLTQHPSPISRLDSVKMALVKQDEGEELIIKPEAVTPAINTSEWPLLLRNWDQRE